MYLFPDWIKIGLNESLGTFVSMEKWIRKGMSISL
jgi:hypothetical protein